VGTLGRGSSGGYEVKEGARSESDGRSVLRAKLFMAGLIGSGYECGLWYDGGRW